MAEWLGETSHGLFRRFPQVSTLVNSPKNFTAQFGIHNCLGEGHEMARGGNPTVVFDSTRRQVSWDIPFHLLFCTFLSLIFFVAFHPKYLLFRWSCNSTGAPPTQMEMATLIVFQPLTTFRSHWKRQKKLGWKLHFTLHCNYWWQC